MTEPTNLKELEELYKHEVCVPPDSIINSFKDLINREIDELDKEIKRIGSSAYTAKAKREALRELLEEKKWNGQKI